MNRAEKFEAKPTKTDAEELEKESKEAQNEAPSERVFSSRAGGFGVRESDPSRHWGSTRLGPPDDAEVWGLTEQE